MTVYAPLLDPDDQRRSLENLKLERDAIVLYEGLSRIEKDARRAAAFRAISANEKRHADIWAARLREGGVDVPEAGRASTRVRLILGLARVFGTNAVSGLVRALEGDEEESYAEQDGPEVAAIAADEREHAEIWKRLDAGMPALAEAALPGRADAIAPVASQRGAIATAAGMAAAAPGVAGQPPGVADAAREDIQEAARARPRDRDESWHRASRSGTLRAAIFGINDGLVSNLSLVMGVAGATADSRFVILAGVAGLLAGAFSMAAGEYISMQSQRELFQRQIQLEREEMRIMPDAEERELAAIYRSKGIPAAEAARLAQRLMQDPEAALDTKVREELGLDPDELGSPWGAAGSSFVAFVIGAIIPLVPYLLTSGASALIAAFVLALGALFVVGAGVSLVTGRSLIFSGLRQVSIGALAAGVTFLVGTLIGVEIGALG
ncbi:MAG: VIT1/CCC1 transporter family protein [Chloroflexota bacterium]|nr:VIT1/CCC1 transporter family protein [Chloroflexota bacterium]